MLLCCRVAWTHSGQQAGTRAHKVQDHVQRESACRQLFAPVWCARSSSVGPSSASTTPSVKKPMHSLRSTSCHCARASQKRCSTWSRTCSAQDSRAPDGDGPAPTCGGMRDSVFGDEGLLLLVLALRLHQRRLSCKLNLWRWGATCCKFQFRPVMMPRISDAPRAMQRRSDECEYRLHTVNENSAALVRQHALFIHCNAVG